MQQEYPEEPPPLFPWKYWYALVLLNLAVLIALFYWFTLRYN